MVVMRIAVRLPGTLPNIVTQCPNAKDQASPQFSFHDRLFPCDGDFWQKARKGAARRDENVMTIT